MLDAHHLAWADEIVDALYLLAKVRPDRPPSVRALAIKLLRTTPLSRPMLNQGELFELEGRFTITTREGLPVERQPEVIGHELGHWWFQRPGGETPPEPAVEEELCDAVGARLSAPKVPFKAAVDAFGHRVHALAKSFHTTQSVALLRIAEVDGRPGLVQTRASRIVRGRAFDWPEDLRSIPREKAHLVRVDGRWGMLAVG